MIKQLLNLVITKYHDLPESRRSIICLSLRLRQIIYLLATYKSRYFAQPGPIIVKYPRIRWSIVSYSWAIMPTVSNYTRTRIESLYRKNLHQAEMFKLLKGEDLKVSFAIVTRIIKKLKLTGSTKKGTSTGRPTKFNAEARAFREDQMWKDNETTSRTIQKKLARRGVMVHPPTVRRSRKQQGWTLQRTRYCQLIRDANKVKRLEFAQKVKCWSQSVYRRSDAEGRWNNQPDTPKEVSQTRSRGPSINSAEISKAAGLDSSTNEILSAD